MNNKLYKELSLSDREKSIILGSLLGDGSLKIHKGYANARFSFRHSIAQKEYFLWKARELAAIGSDKCVFLQKADGWAKLEKLRFQSRALPVLTELYRLTHEQHQFAISRSWLNQLTPLSLAIWWCDDGSIISNGRKGVICTDGFDEKSVRLLARYVEVVWKVKMHVGPITRQRANERVRYWRLWLSTEELKKFLRIIIPYIPVPSMIYKFVLLYKDSQLQQRWISEMESLSVFSRDAIEKAYAERISKRKISENDIVQSLLKNEKS